MSAKIKIVDPEVELIDIQDPVKKVEMAYRICYQSMDKMCEGSESLIKKCLYPEDGSRHETPLEHVGVEVSVPAVVGRAIRQWQVDSERSYIQVYELGDIDNPQYKCYGNLRAFFTFCNQAAYRKTSLFPVEVTASARAMHAALVSAFPSIFERDSWNDEITSIIKINPDAIRVVLDNYYSTFRIVTTRDVLQEFVRHRQLSFNVESTRYCNYEKRGFTFVRPKPYEWAEQDVDPRFSLWYHTAVTACENYLSMLDNGARPEEARMLLPGGLKTEFFVSGTEQAWEHFLELRCDSKAHPQIRYIADQIKEQLGV